VAGRYNISDHYRGIADMQEPSYKEIQETAKALQRASEALIAALENIET
jgi:hypothetical protein